MKLISDIEDTTTDEEIAGGPFGLGRDELRKRQRLTGKLQIKDDEEKKGENLLSMASE